MRCHLCSEASQSLTPIEIDDDLDDPTEMIVVRVCPACFLEQTGEPPESRTERRGA